MWIWRYLELSRLMKRAGCHSTYLRRWWAMLHATKVVIILSGTRACSFDGHLFGTVVALEVKNAEPKRSANNT